MPQKKNPDSLELLRGKAGRVFGNVSIWLLAFVIFYIESGIDGRIPRELQGLAVHLQQGPTRRQGTLV